MWGDSNVCAGVRFLPSEEQLQTDSAGPEGRRVKAPTRRRSYRATKQHLFLVIFSLTETDSPALLFLLMPPQTSTKQ
jgi:hypothetical protein